ncbi:MAG: DUF423 domain-containing protein [Bacteroidia bacterium]
MSKTFLILGAAAAFLAVAIGAFGAHAVKSRISADLLEIYNTGTAYHFYHSFAVLIVGILLFLAPHPNGWLNWSGWLFLAGIILFSGSLYTLALSGIRTFGAVTPFGGLCFLAGWLCMAVGSWRAFSH